MRDLFENTQPHDPVEAARRGLRPLLRRRFYQRATAESAADGHVACLDGVPIRTPAGHALAAPTLALAEAIAAEWEAQRDVIDPANMPLTRLANAIIDGVAHAARPVAAEIEKYLASDLLFYRVNTAGRIMRAPGAVLGSDPDLGSRSARRGFQAGRRRRPRQLSHRLRSRPPAPRFRTIIGGLARSTP